MAKLSKLAHLSSSSHRGERFLMDAFDRVHDYLRISLTERCNLRCRYCMPAEGIKLTRDEDCLSASEIERISRIFIERCGVKKIRLTGGEPTVDLKLLPILRYINGLRQKGLQTIGLTTNGFTLKRSNTALPDINTSPNAGLNLLNVSLDTLDPMKYEQITRRKGLKLVLDGLQSALAAKFDKVKLNCVVMRGVNDNELVDFVRFAREHPIEVRFIEFMPFLGNRWDDTKMIPYNEMVDIISKEIPNLSPIVQGIHETSKLFREPGAAGTIGFITSMTSDFCGGCNRLRLTADGNLKVCLFDRAETSLRDLIRNEATDDEIVQAIAMALGRKERKHAGLKNLKHDVSRPMITIGSRMLHSLVGIGVRNSSNNFTHIDSKGKARMVNVGNKGRVRRIAVARGEIVVGSQVVEKILVESLAKGNILTVAKVAGILGAKMTSNLIPMCHQIALEHVHIGIVPKLNEGILEVEARVEAEHKTGVEMESLMAVSITLLTIYDMCKSAVQSIQISDIRLLSKEKLSPSTTPREQE